MPTPLTTKLRRYSLTVYEGSNPADATVRAYRQGATVRVGITIPLGGSGTVEVYDVGRLQDGDTLQKGTSVTPIAVVGTITRRDQVPLTVITGGMPLVLVPGDRLVSLTTPPQPLLREHWDDLDRSPGKHRPLDRSDSSDLLDGKVLRRHR